MRITRAGSFFLLAVLFALGIKGQCVSAAEIYTVIGNQAPPYRIIEKKKNKLHFSGIYFDLVQEMARRAGFTVKFKRVPFKRALVMMRQGRADIMPGPNRTSEREVYMAYLDVPLSKEAKVFYLKKGAPDIIRYGDLSGRKIGVIRGARYHDRFDGDETLLKIKVSNYATVLRVIWHGRVDAGIMPELLGDYLLQHEGIVLRKASLVFKGRPSFLAISKKSSLMGKKSELEAALRAVKSSGKLQEIINRYK